MHPEELGIGRLFERVRDAVVVADASSGRVVLWNPAAARIFGYATPEALGMRVEALVPARLKDRHRAGMARYGASGRGPLVDSDEYLELPAVRKDGEEIRIELSLSPMEAGGSGEGGRYVLAVVRDATRRKAAEEALRESEERMRGLADAAFEGILITDRGVILEANQAFFGMLGYEPEDVVGRPALEFVAPEHRGLVGRNMLSGYEEPYEIAGVDAAGRRVELEVRGRAFTYRGRPVRVTTLQNIAERKKAEREIRRLNKTLERRIEERTRRLAESEERLRELLGRLVAAQDEERRRVAYEIHDGLTQVAIAAHQRVQIFARSHPPGSKVEPSELDGVLALARRVVREARLVIEGLRPTALDDHGLPAALRLMVDELRSEGWEVAYEEDMGTERLASETETALYRVAQEALANVRKHAGVERARVELTRKPREVRLEIEDKGRGFDPAAVSRGEGPGERVGLAGMRERVALLGGELRIASEPGRGASVTVRVPASTEADGGG